ncbi:MAG: ACP S-malonyltransferase [Candidatus Omnitrophota bacterium]
MKAAFIFPGQGAQFVGMGKDLYENSQAARQIFEKANKVLGFPLDDLCFQGPAEELTKTQNCQPAILTVSIAALAALRSEDSALVPLYTAGLSLGEYSTLVAADIIEFEDAVYVVRKRGEFMDAAAQKRPGKMSCVLGLEEGEVASVCQDTGCEIANLNCPGQVVISGGSQQLEAAADGLMRKGAKKVIALDVSGAFHCSYMDEAGSQLRLEIDKIKFHEGRIPIICNVDAQPQTNPQIIKDNLIKQVNTTTYWERSMRYLLSKGVDTFFEIGPGTVLKGLLKKIDRSITVISVGNWNEVLESRKARV